MVSKALFALAAAQTASAHFGLAFPAWRADTLASEDTSKYSQWTYPCASRSLPSPRYSHGGIVLTRNPGAGVPYGAGNVTDWPLDGGALKLDLHHPWTYIFVNLGLGGNTTNFNISLTPEFWNATGKGTLCIDKVPLPVKVEDGALASLQVVTLGQTGSALYNCADIRFKKDAQAPGNCTSGGIGVTAVKQQNGNGTTSGNSTGGNSTSGGDKKGSSAGTLGVNTVALGTIAGLASVFAMGFGF
ncbi:hypothetical protein TOPH_04240 [Tolypocladium ophioglossoides CBS 100239]|uniref:Copper acquisition factor BIM1-like domain-containing protein n=1 Tax=Tolypocladium ophioglossoides (strain CBS 100239) TaxID=1163406 RepID=A0A0L0NBI8_TOLOC|nr:hypothetical protein TOPH_04240 [Tolypocladium ophioglossoides CBS 100239]